MEMSYSIFAKLYYQRTTNHIQQNLTSNPKMKQTYLFTCHRIVVHMLEDGNKFHLGIHWCGKPFYYICQLVAITTSK